MESNLHPESRSARIAASLFFVFCIPMSLWETNYVGRKIFVSQDPVATANNLLSNEFIFRTSILSHLLGTIIFVLMMILFYRILRPVDKHLARLMMVPMVAQIAIVFVLEVFNFSALMILKGEARTTFDITQQQEVAHLLLRINRFGIGADKIPFGLAFIPFGMLVLRSGFAPKIIGILILIGAAGYIADTTLFILVERSHFLAIRSIMFYAYPSYMLALLWFAIKGLRMPRNSG